MGIGLSQRTSRRNPEDGLAARRRFGQRPYDTQIAGGIALHEGAVVEMPTGEGKTLAAVAPVFLHALAGRGAHVLTFNDYLARRDAGWMGPVYELLGLEVGFVQEGMPPDERRRAYARDVIYLTAKEAGFDLLRDGLCLDPSEPVHRPLRFALVDEADSVLIDEAGRNVLLTGEGIAAAEEALGRGSLVDPERIEDGVVESFAELATGPDGPDWEHAGLRGPSATWTYMVHDEVFGGNLFLGLANRASIGLWAVLLTWPLLLAWGLYLRWKRRKGEIE